MLDVNQITSTLRGLPDRALQQYAMLHKGDPYILSLAVSESNQRKQLRMAGQGQAGAMPQPKVADAAIAGMVQQQLPENQGIAQIPTPNMQGMANGGIAGYEDDEEGMATGGMGGMFNFAQQSEPVVRMAGGGVARYNGATGSVTGVAPELLSKYQQEATEMAMGTRMQFSPDVKAVVGKIQAAQEGSYLKEEQKQMLEGNPLRNKAQTSTSMAAPTASAAYDPTENLKKLAQTNAKYTTPSAPKNAEEAAMLNRYPATKPAADKAPPAPPSGNKPPVSSAEKQGLATLAPSKAMTADEAKVQAGDFVDYEESRTALRKAESDQESQGARLRTMLADSLPKTPAMEGLEKLLDKQDAATGGEKDKAAGLALLSAGLAIAGGSSRYALQNLKEAIPAVAQYGDALKDIKKMERENMKLRGDIEQARRAEGRDDTKLKLQLEEKIGDRKDKINELGIGLTSKIAGTTADVASKLWTSSFEAQNRKEIALFEAQNRKDVAGIQSTAAANAELNKYTQLGSADPNSALAKGFQMYKQESSEPTTYANYVKLTTDPMNGEAFQKRFPTFEVYKAGMSSGKGQIYSDNNVNPNAVRSR